MDRQIKIIGGGLAGCELALQLADWGIDVHLYEMKPKQRHKMRKGDVRPPKQRQMPLLLRNQPQRHQQMRKKKNMH